MEEEKRWIEIGLKLGVGEQIVNDWSKMAETKGEAVFSERKMYNKLR